MTYEWAYVFPKVSTTLWRLFRHFHWRMAVRVHIGRVVAWCLRRKSCVKYWGSHFSNRFLWETNCLNGYIYYRIHMLKIPWGWILNNVCRVSVDIMELILKKVMVAFFGRFLSQAWWTNGSYFAYKKIIFGKKEHLISNWESPEWKHLNFFKGKWFNLVAFLIFVKMLPAASRA